jgi:nicotinamidase-related amidase
MPPNASTIAVQCWRVNPSNGNNHQKTGGNAVGKSALMVMDVQNAMLERFAAAEALVHLQSAVQFARSREVPVIFVRVALRAGYPDVSPKNLSFSSLKERGGMLETDPATQIWDGVRPQPLEVVVVKRRVSAFTGSGLEVVLRAQEIDHLILCGIATSGVVLSTLRQAADQDFELTVLSDACLDSDPEVHRVLMEKVFPRQAHVQTVAEWQAALASDGTA